MATKKKSRKKSTKPKKSIRKKATLTTRPKKTARKKKAAPRKASRKTSSRRRAPEFSAKVDRTRSGDQSGDLQGLSRRETADSESVDELLEEGNAFEADAVMGVEDAEGNREKEVRTHEVPEDDVPEEYLDKD
jgi:hypothetical protein